MLLFLLLSVDLSTVSVGVYFEYDTLDTAVYITYFGISTMAGMIKVKTTYLMSSAFYGSVLGVLIEGVLSCGGVFDLVGWLALPFNCSGRVRLPTRLIGSQFTSLGLCSV